MYRHCNADMLNALLHTILWHAYYHVYCVLMYMYVQAFTLGSTVRFVVMIVFIILAKFTFKWPNYSVPTDP